MLERGPEDLPFISCSDTNCWTDSEKSAIWESGLQFPNSNESIRLHSVQASLGQSPWLQAQGSEGVALETSTTITLWSWTISHFRYGTIVIAILIFKIMIYVPVESNVWKSRNICMLNIVYKKQILGVDCVRMSICIIRLMYIWYIYRYMIVYST